MLEYMSARMPSSLYDNNGVSKLLIVEESANLGEESGESDVELELGIGKQQILAAMTGTEGRLSRQKEREANIIGDCTRLLLTKCNVDSNIKISSCNKSSSTEEEPVDDVATAPFRE